MPTYSVLPLHFQNITDVSISPNLFSTHSFTIIQDCLSNVPLQNRGEVQTFPTYMFIRGNNEGLTPSFAIPIVPYSSESFSEAVSPTYITCLQVQSLIHTCSRHSMYDGL